MTGFLDQPFLQKLVGDHRGEGTTQMQMIGDILDADVSIRRKVTDRNQHRVFDACKADQGTVAFAHRRMTCQKTKEIMNKAAELLVGAVDQQFWPRNRQRRLSRRLEWRRFYL